MIVNGLDGISTWKDRHPSERLDTQIKLMNWANGFTKRSIWDFAWQLLISKAKIEVS